MLYAHKKYIREDVSHTLNATNKLDLPEHGKLSGIFLRISGSDVSGLAQAGGKWRIIDYINKIELVGNGSIPIKSLRGDLLQAIGWMDQGVTAPDQWQNYATNTQWCFIPILFGRHLYDTELYLDLAKWSSVELQITNNASSSEFSDLTISTMGVFLEPENQVPPELGFLRTEEWRSWTTVQNAWQYLDLPTENLIRRIIMQAVPAVNASFIEDTGMWNMADDVALNLRTGATEIYRGGIDDLMRASNYEFKQDLHTSGSSYMNADKGFDVGIGYVTGMSPGAGSMDGAVATAPVTIEGKNTGAHQKPEAYEADTLVEFIARGVCYHNCVPIFNPIIDNQQGWIDPNVDATVQLNVHTRDSSSADNGAIRIILDRLIRV